MDAAINGAEGSSPPVDSSSPAINVIPVISVVPVDSTVSVDSSEPVDMSVVVSVDSSEPADRSVPVHSSMPPTIAPPPLPIEFAMATAPPLPPRDDKSSRGRKVQNLKDMLNYFTKITAEHPPGTVDMTRDEDRMRFLSSAFTDISVNVHEEINNSINILLDTYKDETELLYAFDVLDGFVDNIDFANDFEKLLGFKVFTPCLMSQYAAVRLKTADLIGLVLQNNSRCQEKFIEDPTYTRLLIHMVEEDKDEAVRLKCLHALSCLVRDNIEVFWRFMELGGDDLILLGLRTSSEKYLIKTTFLVLATSAMDSVILEFYIKKNMVELLCGIIVDMDRIINPLHHDLFLTAFYQFLDKVPELTKERCAVFKLQPILQALKTSHENEAMYEDAVEQIDAILLRLGPVVNV